MSLSRYSNQSGNTKNIAADYTVVPGDGTILVDTTSGSRTITLPDATNLRTRVFTIKKTDASANTITVTTTSSQLIDLNATYALSATGSSVTVQSNGTNWAVIATIVPPSSTFTSEISGPDLRLTGLSGATTPIRIAGGTSHGKPVSGTFTVGDLVVDVSGNLWVCTTAPLTFQRANIPITSANDLIVGLNPSDLARTATASSPQGGNPQYANDGNSATGWILAGTTVGQLVMDLGSSTVITSAYYNSGTSYSMASANLDGSDDNSTWTTYGTGSGFTYTFTVSNAPAHRYWRLNATGSLNHVEVDTFSLYGGSTGDPSRFPSSPAKLFQTDINGNWFMGYTSTSTTKTAAYTITMDNSTIRADATTAALTITLPTAVGCNGKRFSVKKIDTSANVVTVGTTSTQTMDGATTYSLATQYSSVTVESNGTNWDIVAKT